MHPTSEALALQAGGDLRRFARWRMERHLARCASCRAQVAAFQSLRDSTAGLAPLPELPWKSLEAEMRANIHLGLSAGECVRAAEGSGGFRRRWRPVAAAVGIAAVVFAAVTLEERPRIHSGREENAALRAAPDGVGSQSLRLMYPGAVYVQTSASAAGAVQARYTDPGTLYMTVSEVDAQ